MIAVPPPAQDVLACRNVFRDNHSVLDGEGVRVDAWDGVGEREGRLPAVGGARVMFGTHVRAGGVGSVERRSTARAMHPRAVVAWAVMQRHVVVARVGADVRKGVDPPPHPTTFDDVGGVDRHVLRRVGKPEDMC